MSQAEGVSRPKGGGNDECQKKARRRRQFDAQHDGAHGRLLGLAGTPSPRCASGYETWRLATEQIRYLMSGVVHGSSISIDPIYQKRAEVYALQEDWMRMAERLLRPAGRGAPNNSGGAL